MKAQSIRFRGYLCFQDEYSGFEDIKPLNVLIGRNNSGKSTLLDLLDAMCSDKLKMPNAEIKCTGVLDESDLKSHFSQHMSGGDLSGHHWKNFGRCLVDKTCSWRVGKDGVILDIEIDDLNPSLRNPSSSDNIAVRKRVSKILATATHEFSGRGLRRLLADRDIRPEVEETKLELTPDGQGATNIIRRLLLSTSEEYPRDLIQKTLLEALNEIFSGDAEFSEIQIQYHDVGDDFIKGKYEVFLGEESKGLIPLSKTGSGLKTILLILLNLLIVPEIEKKEYSSFVFSFEEPENNLHPALLRRLFSFLEHRAVNNDCPIFLTTHSSTALDVFGLSEYAQVIQIKHNGDQATSSTVRAHFDRINVVSDLGASPSDLLQANGVIWVEGPSDRIYLNRWIELFSDGELSEGRDYQCAFFGGALLGRTQWVDMDSEIEELANLIRINSNVILVCDGDRSASSGRGSRIKARVSRVKREVEKAPGSFIWITDAREIENYLTANILSRALALEVKRDPTQYESFFPRKSSVSKKDSYLEKMVGRRSMDKVELALITSPLMTKEQLSKRFELKARVNEIVSTVRSWSN